MTAPSEQPRWFQAVDRSRLASTAAKSGAFTASAQVINAALGAGATIALARLLTPDDFGLFAMVASFQFLLAAVRDLGIGQAIIQRESIEAAQVHAMFRWSVIAAVANVVAFAACAPLLDWFYDEPRVLAITLWFGLFGGITALSGVPRALLSRAMRFGAVGSIGVVSTLAGCAAAIVAAWQGAGYWALVVQPGVSAVVGTVLAFGAVGYRPTAEGSLRESVDLLKFGAKSTGSAMLHNVVRNADNIIIGRASGEAALGQYTMAYRLLLMPIRQINNPLVQVAVPTLSRLQDDPERYRRFYVHALRAATAFGMPLVGLLALLSGHLIPLLLGPGWERSIDLFLLLAIPAFLGTFNFATGVAYLTCGAVGRQLGWTLFAAPITVGGFVIGSRWGPEGVAVAFATTVLLLRPLGIWYCARWTLVTVGDVGAGVWRASLASLLPLGFGAALVGLGGVDEPSWAHVVAATGLYAACYAALWVLMPGGRAAMRDMLETVRLLRAPRGEGGDA